MKINDEKFMKAMNEQYIQNKQIEIAMEATRLAIEKRNEQIAQAAIDEYTLSLMENNII